MSGIFKDMGNAIKEGFAKANVKYAERKKYIDAELKKLDNVQHNSWASYVNDESDIDRAGLRVMKAGAWLAKHTSRGGTLLSVAARGGAEAYNQFYDHIRNEYNKKFGPVKTDPNKPDPFKEAFKKPPQPFPDLSTTVGDNNPFHPDNQSRYKNICEGAKHVHEETEKAFKFPPYIQKMIDKENRGETLTDEEQRQFSDYIFGDDEQSDKSDDTAKDTTKIDPNAAKNDEPITRKSFGSAAYTDSTFWQPVKPEPDKLITKEDVNAGTKKYDPDEIIDLFGDSDDHPDSPDSP